MVAGRTNSSSVFSMDMASMGTTYRTSPTSKQHIFSSCSDLVPIPRQLQHFVATHPSFQVFFILFYFISSRIVFPAIVLEQGTTITITLGPLPVYQAYGPHRTSTDLIVLPPHRMIQVLHSLPVLSTSTSSCRHQIGTLPDTTLDTRSM